MNDILRMVTKQEELLRFDSFSNDDAFALGCLLASMEKSLVLRRWRLVLMDWLYFGIFQTEPIRRMAFGWRQSEI